jgi:cell division protein FtsI (penicillin-binding protein 3)
MRPGTDPGLRLAQRRLRLVGGLFTLVMLALALRLVDLALWQGEHAISGRALAGAMDSARRADIVDRNGTLLATDYPKTSLYADPAAVLDPAAAAARLADVLYGVDPAELAAKLAEPRRFVWLKRHITETERRAVVRLGVPGVGFRSERHRVYPQRALAGHLVGYVGVENQGLTGLERSFESRLTAAETNQTPLILTLDLGVQEVVRSELAAARARFDALGASGIVLDVATGELLASVSLPDFDPNNYQRARPEALFNRNTLGTYELGSLFKLFTVAMALDAGAADIAGGFDATAPLQFGRFRISDFHAKRRWLSVPEVIAFSSNIGAAKMAQALGGEGQLAYFERFGLLDRHPIRLPEVGLPQRPSRWRPINTVTAAYGHGLAVSPLQVADAVAAAVCSAPRPRAHLVGEELPALWDRPPVSAATAAKLRWLMWLTVTEGTGKLAKVPGYLVGGKTGSADKPGRDGGYRHGGLLASFVAAFPIDQPRYVVLIIFDEPKGDAETYGQAHGGWTAAPTVGRIISRIGPLLGLPPVDPGAELWFRERLVEGQAQNGWTGRIEPSFAVRPGVSWGDVTQGEVGCGCQPCSILG